MISAVLDACVLYSASLRDFLLRLAEDGLFDPFWSEEIQNEWTRRLLMQNRTNVTQESLKRTRQQMESHFPRGLVRGYETITPSLILPEPNDRHVLAVAIRAKAKNVVTFNLKDFPMTALQPYEIEAVSPDEFVFRLIQTIPDRLLWAVKSHRLSLKRPPKTVDEYIATLEKQGLPKTVAFLREHKENI